MKTELRVLRSILLSIWIMAGFLVHAEEIIVIEGNEIRGNQEQPKILYIIPWQRPLQREGLEPDTLQLLGQDLLQPIYREEFVRRLGYHEHLMQPTSPIIVIE